jgi:hypothetical protein
VARPRAGHCIWWSYGLPLDVRFSRRSRPVVSAYPPRSRPRHPSGPRTEMLRSVRAHWFWFALPIVVVGFGTVCAVVLTQDDGAGMVYQLR